MYKLLFLLTVCFSHIVKGEENQNEVSPTWAHDSDVYKNGFLYSTKQNVLVPPHYKKVSPNLWIDSRLDIAQTNKVCMIGIAIDARTANTLLSEIASDLDRSLDVSERAFHENGDYLCGRYIILYKAPDGKTKIVSDAAGQRTIYHSLDGSVVASHAKLVTDNLQERDVEISLNQFGRRGTYPGKSTPYQGVFALTPNTTLELDTGTIHRFYPYRNVDSVSAEEAAHEIGILCTNILKGIEALAGKQKKDLLISLTAGIDSRTTLALAKTALQAVPLTFTYRWIPRDFLLTPKLCTKLHIPHVGIEFAKRDETYVKKFYPILARNTYWSISKDPYHDVEVSLVNPTTLNAFQNRYIHIRSSIYEIGRAFFYKNSQKKDRFLPFSEEALLHMFFLSNGKGIWSESDISQVRESLHYYCQETKLNQKTLFNLDIRDIYYWEQRVGTWLAQMTLEDDILFDTLMIYNCRAILTKSLQVPFDDRVNGMVQKIIIRDHWKELCDWDVNGKLFWHDHFKVNKKLKKKNSAKALHKR